MLYGYNACLINLFADTLDCTLNTQKSQVFSDLKKFDPSRFEGKGPPYTLLYPLGEDLVCALKRICSNRNSSIHIKCGDKNQTGESGS